MSATLCTMSALLVSLFLLALPLPSASSGVDWKKITFDRPYDPPRSHRAAIPLNQGWLFHKGHTVSGRPYETWFWDQDWEGVVLPHTWNSKDGQDGGDDYFRGVGWYRKRFEIKNPEFKEGKRRFYLQFDGAMLVTHVWLNNKFVGKHKGGFAAFRFDVTEHVDLNGENVVAVRVNNAYNRDVMPLWPADFTFFGGLYRNVSLLVTNVLHVSVTDYGSWGVSLSTSNVSSSWANVEVSALVDNIIMGETIGTVRIIIVDREMNVLDAVSATHKVPALARRIEFAHKGVLRMPRLWDGRRDPYMYRVYVEVRDHQGLDPARPDVVTDLVWQPLGLRSYSVSPTKGFSLNGRPYQLRGVSRHQDRLDKGWALAPEDDKEDMGLLEEIGATAVRLGHYQQSQTFLDLCDERGIVVWVEIPLVKLATNSKAFFKNAQEQLIELIRQNRNHPAIIFWGLGNEQDSTDEASDKLIESLANKVQSEDMPRYSVYAHSGETGRLDPCTRHTDLIGLNKFLGWYGGWHDSLGPWVDIFHAKHPQLRLGISAYGAGASTQHHADPPFKFTVGGGFHPEEYQSLLHEEHWKAIRARPFLWGAFVETMFDYASDWRKGGEYAGQNDKGLVTYDRKTRKDAFYWYKANWNDWEPFVYVTSRRYTPRAKTITTVKVYSNMQSVELKINDHSMGIRKLTDHIFLWDVQLAQGENEVTAIGKNANGKWHLDSATWMVQSGGGAGKQGGQ